MGKGPIVVGGRDGLDTAAPPTRRQTINPWAVPAQPRWSDPRRGAASHRFRVPGTIGAAVRYRLENLQGLRTEVSMVSENDDLPRLDVAVTRALPVQVLELFRNRHDVWVNRTTVA